MSRRHDRKRGGRKIPKGTRPLGRPRAVEDELPPFVADVRACLRERSPLPLLSLASALIEMTTPRHTDRWVGQEERPDGPTLFESFIQSGWPEMAALALAVATMHPDEVLAARLRSEVALASPPLSPSWVRRLGEVEITSTGRQADILGDGENLLVSWTWTGGRPATAVIYVDHNMGTLVKDAFVLDEDGERIAAVYADIDASATTEPIDPADLAARVREAIAHTEIVVPPIESETWPACRTLVEWILRQLPDGGTGYVRPEWSEADRDDLLDEFAGVAGARVDGLSEQEVRELAEPLVWFACDWGPGDPLRWSPVSVEIVLADWYPRKVFGLPARLIERLPDLLAELVRFAHERRGIPAARTEETLASIEQWAPEFFDAIDGPDRSPAANAEQLARIAAGLPEPDAPGERFEPSVAELADDFEAMLIESSGGLAAYEALDDAPLPDVAFDWSGVPEASRELTAATLQQLDRWSVQLLDVEVRTMARAILRVVVVEDRSVFRRSARTDALAAGILGLVVRRLPRWPAGGAQSVPWEVQTQKELASATGVSASTISSRSRTIENVLDDVDFDWPAILHSCQRREILAARATLDSWRHGDQTAE